MLKKLQNNIKFFRRYWRGITPKSLRSEGLPEQDSSMEKSLKNMKAQQMHPIKIVALFSLKLVIFLALANIILVKPLSNGISKALESFDNNPLIKIVSLDFINNPLTFIRMSEYYLDKNDIKKSQLYLQYAETIKARYPYPQEINTQLLELRAKIKNSSK